MSDAFAASEIYQFRVVVRDTSPHLWRRLRVNRNTTLAEFHHILQVALGWSGSRPYRFLIRGKALGINSPGGQNEVDQLRLADFHFLLKERFVYEYDCHPGSNPRWQHQVRFERTLPGEPQRLYPVCLGGLGTTPPENCGDPKDLREFSALFTPGYILHRLAALLDDGLTEKGIEELRHLRPWITLSEFDRRMINRKLKLEPTTGGSRKGRDG